MKGPAHEKNAEQLQYNGFRFFVWLFCYIWEKQIYLYTV